MLPHIINSSSISIMVDGTMKSITDSHANFEKIKQAIKNGDWDNIPTLINLSKQVEDTLEAQNISDITIKNGIVYYNGKPVHNTLTARIVQMINEDFNVAHMVKFMSNLMQNPSHRAVTSLYDFLEAGKIPITENGTFLAYKKVRFDYKDIHSGTFDNSIGVEVSMPRNMVDEDPEKTCSAGLHVCSYDYLPHFSSTSQDRVVICEINPADVVAIPKDYKNTKMRCCKYKVIGEVDNYKTEDTLAKKACVDTSAFSCSKPRPYVEPTPTLNEKATAQGILVTNAILSGDMTVYEALLIADLIFFDSAAKASIEPYLLAKNKVLGIADPAYRATAIGKFIRNAINHGAIDVDKYKSAMDSLLSAKPLNLDGFSLEQLVKIAKLVIIPGKTAPMFIELMNNIPFNKLPRDEAASELRIVLAAASKLNIIDVSDSIIEMVSVADKPSTCSRCSAPLQKEATLFLICKSCGFVH